MSRSSFALVSTPFSIMYRTFTLGYIRIPATKQRFLPLEGGFLRMLLWTFLRWTSARNPPAIGLCKIVNTNLKTCVLYRLSSLCNVNKLCDISPLCQAHHQSTFRETLVSLLIRIEFNYPGPSIPSLWSGFLGVAGQAKPSHLARCVFVWTPVEPLLRSCSFFRWQTHTLARNSKDQFTVEAPRDSNMLFHYYFKCFFRANANFAFFFAFVRSGVVCCDRSFFILHSARACRSWNGG